LNELTVAVLAGLWTFGWSLGLLFAGLWWGERGRRKDAQRREGVLRVDPIEPATVMGQKDGPPDGTQRELQEAPERFIAETMPETECTEEEARAEWNRLVARSFGEGSGGWTTELP